ncbi:MAG: hypothetical protein GY841_06820 [FCB group bacterium]|nr:hypothetical protein [FCB group bacterium]
MNQKNCLTIIIAINACLFLFIGCSNENDQDIGLGAGHIVKLQGDTLDIPYLTVLEAHDWVDENIELLMIQAFWVMEGRLNIDPDTISDDLSKPYGSSSMVYDSVGQYWHYLNIMSPGTREIIQNDSIRFYHGDVVVKWPDSALLTEVWAGGSLVWVLHNDIGADTVIDAGIDFVLESVPGLIAAYGDAILSATGYCCGRPWNQPAEIEEGCGFDIDLTVTMTDLALTVREVFNFASWPHTGEIELTGPIVLTCAGDTAYVHADVWNVVTAYINGVPSTAVENSDYFWPVD